jgi:hypothetical protein
VSDARLAGGSAGLADSVCACSCLTSGSVDCAACAAGWASRSSVHGGGPRFSRGRHGGLRVDAGTRRRRPRLLYACWFGVTSSTRPWPPRSWPAVVGDRGPGGCDSSTISEGRRLGTRLRQPRWRIACGLTSSLPTRRRPYPRPGLHGAGALPMEKAGESPQRLRQNQRQIFLKIFPAPPRLGPRTEPPQPGLQPHELSLGSATLGVAPPRTTAPSLLATVEYSTKSRFR